MRFFLRVDRAAAIRGGYNQSGEVPIEIDPAQLTPEDRDLLARFTDGENKIKDGGNWITAQAPTIEAALTALRAWDEKIRQIEAERREKEEQELREKEEYTAESLRLRRTSGAPGNLSPDYGRYGRGLNYAAKRWNELKAVNSEEWKRWEEEIAAENKRFNEQQKAEREAQEKAAEKRKRAGEKMLREWALKHGSELLRARLEEGYNWIGLAQEEYADAVAARVAGSLTPAETPDGYTVGDNEKRQSPTLAEIQSLRALRNRIGSDNMSDQICAELVYVSYEPTRDDDGYEYEDADADPIKRSELELRLSTPDGSTQYRYYLPPGDQPTA